MQSLKSNVIPSICVGLVLGGSAVSAATIPYAENFDDETVGATTGPTEGAAILSQSSRIVFNAAPALPTEPTGTGSAAFSVDGDGHYQFVLASSKGNSTNNTQAIGAASLPFPDLAGSDFVTTAKVARDAIASQSNNGSYGAGVAARASDADLTLADTGYRLSLNLGSGNNITSTSGSYRGKLILSEGVDGATLGGDSAFASLTAASVLTITTDEFYTLRLTGTVDGTSLILLGEVLDAAGTKVLASVTTTDTNPQLGTYFGLRAFNTSSSGTQTATIDYDDLSVVPEPSALAVAGLAAAALLRRRR